MQKCLQYKKVATSKIVPESEYHSSTFLMIKIIYFMVCCLASQWKYLNMNYFPVRMIYQVNEEIYLKVYHLLDYYFSFKKVHNGSYLQVFSTCQQSLVSIVFLMLHKPNMWVIFKFSLGTKRYSCFFVNLDMSCTYYALSMFCVYMRCILYVSLLCIYTFVYVHVHVLCMSLATFVLVY